MNAFYERIHRHTKIVQFSIYFVHCIIVPCSLSLLVVASLHVPKGGCGLGLALIRGLGMGLGRGLRWGIHLLGDRLRGGLGWSWGACLPTSIALPSQLT